MSKHNRLDGAASIWTTSWFLRALLTGDEPLAVSNSMSIVRNLERKDPSLWARVKKYLDPNCGALGGKKTSLVALGKGTTTPAW